MAKVKKAGTWPPLSKSHKLKCHDWAKRYLKTDFSKVLWRYEIRVTLDGPDGWSFGWITNGHRAPLRMTGGSKVEVGILGWAAIKDELAG